MNVLDLFSGIGGFSLGLERAGMRTIAFCEVNEWCQRLLKKHWPTVPQLEDVTKLGIEPMSSSGDSPAKISALPGEAPALPAAVPLSGGGYAEPFAWYDRATQSWRTWQRCLIEGWTLYAETWPRSGMTRSGIAYRLPPLALPTEETESGSWPTPTASGFEVADVDALLARRERMAAKYGNNGFGLTLNQAVKLWPTPTSRDYKDGSAKACANVPANGLLGRVVHQYATPQARDYRTGQASRWDNRERSRNLNDQIGGSLNPTWVEWLMGYPLGWTVSKVLETPSSRKSRKSSAKPSSPMKELPPHD